MSLNIVILTGRLTEDPKIINTKNDLTISNFSIAINKGFGDKQETYFFECKAMGKFAEAIEKNWKKGSLVSLSGALQQDRWEKDGQKHSKVVIWAEKGEILVWGEKKEQKNEQYTDYEGGDIPF